MLTISDLENMLKISKIFILSLVSMAVLHGMFLILLKKRAKDETFCNIGVYVIYFVLRNVAGAGLTLSGLMFAYQFGIFDVQTSVLNLSICVVLADFLYYWKHRLEHTTRVLWIAHSPHHSSSEFNLSTALRLPWLTPFYSWAIYIPLCLIGFHPLMVIFSLTVVLAYQFLIHTESIRTMGFLEHILNTPSNHRVHHGSNDKYLDKNYGGIFIIWDKLFNTFQQEEEKVVYGLTKPIHTTNPIKVNFIDLIDLIKETLSLKKPSLMVKYLLKGPGDA